MNKHEAYIPPKKINGSPENEQVEKEDIPFGKHHFFGFHVRFLANNYSPVN